MHASGSEIFVPSSVIVVAGFKEERGTGRAPGPWRWSWARAPETGPCGRVPPFSFFISFSFLFEFKCGFEFKFKSIFDQLVKQGHPIYDFGVV